MSGEQRSKHDVAAKLRSRYLAADRGEKERLLDEFVDLTDHHVRAGYYTLPIPGLVRGRCAWAAPGQQ
ncbi:MAG: hypothetical protein ACYC5J_15065 [Chloroflexota bacterium]